MSKYDALSFSKISRPGMHIFIYVLQLYTGMYEGIRLHKYSLPVLIAKCRKKFNALQYLLNNKDSHNRNTACLCTVKHRATCIFIILK
jgi:hypothetical protein